MLSKDAEMILKRYKKFFQAFEEYDKTGRFPLDKIRRSFTIKEMTFQRLKTASKKTGKSMSRLLDELVDKELG